MINKKIETLIKNNHLGNIVININKVKGGLSHKIFKVETDQGAYAIKELNSGIMKRETAYSNFVFSEKVTDFEIYKNLHKNEKIHNLKILGK